MVCQGRIKGKEAIIDRDNFRKQVKEYKGFHETEGEPVKKKRFCMEEQKKDVGERIKSY